MANTVSAIRAVKKIKKRTQVTKIIFKTCLVYHLTLTLKKEVCFIFLNL